MGGMTSVDMRWRRARFKCELKFCKANENYLRSESLQKKKTIFAELASLWKDAWSFISSVRRQLQKAEGVSGDIDLANLWREKYSNKLNKTYDRTQGTMLEALRRVPRSRVDFT